MPDAAVINLVEKYGLWGILAMIVLAGAQAFFGARGRNSAYPARDEKHDANVGALREVQTMISALDRNIERRHEEDMRRIERMHEDASHHRETLGHRMERVEKDISILMDRTER